MSDFCKLNQVDAVEAWNPWWRRLRRVDETCINQMAKWVHSSPKRSCKNGMGSNCYECKTADNCYTASMMSLLYVLGVWKVDASR